MKFKVWFFKKKTRDLLQILYLDNEKVISSRQLWLEKLTNYLDENANLRKKKQEIFELTK